jgi:hypothetical protein
MRSTPLGQNWVVHYSGKGGERGIGFTDHYSKLPFIIQLLLEDGAENIYIVDKTFYKDEE